MGPLRPAPRRGSYPANSEMNVTPFVDVMLVLLIVFMIAAPLSTVSVPVDLPESSARIEEPALPDPVFVSIDRGGAVFVMQEPIAMARLGETLRERTRGSTDERIYLRADEELAYRTVMEVMARIQEAGFSRIGLVAEETAPAPS